MSKNGLRRYYDRLTAEERFRLDVLAMARGDLKESERLVSSCPKFSYTMNDRGFTGRWLSVLDMTLRVYLGIAGHLERIAMMGGMREVLPFQDRYACDRMRDAYLEGHRAGARQARGAAKGKGPEPERPHEGIDEGRVDELAELGASVLPEILEGLERKEAGHALTLWRGFGAFCYGTLGLDASKVLRVVHAEGAARVEELEALAGRLDLDPDPENRRADTRGPRGGVGRSRGAGRWVG